MPTKPLLDLEFEGISSGDGECHCWAVDEATFTRLTGHAPVPMPEELLEWREEGRLSLHSSHYYPDMFDYYPPFSPATHKDGEGRKVRVRITIEEIEQ